MQLKTVHTYQSVRFNKRDETHFDAAKPIMAGMVMELHPAGYVVITLGQEQVLVFATNVAYAVPATPEVATKASAKK